MLQEWIMTKQEKDETDTLHIGENIQIQKQTQKQASWKFRTINNQTLDPWTVVNRQNGPLMAGYEDKFTKSKDSIKLTYILSRDIFNYTMTKRRRTRGNNRCKRLQKH